MDLAGADARAAFAARSAQALVGPPVPLLGAGALCGAPPLRSTLSSVIRHPPRCPSRAEVLLTLRLRAPAEVLLTLRPAVPAEVVLTLRLSLLTEVLLTLRSSCECSPALSHKAGAARNSG